MPGTKRKASFAFPYERPAKLAKSSTSTGLAGSTGSLAKSPSVKSPRFTPLKFPSLRATKPATREIALSSSESSGSDVSKTPTSLRRASTLTLEDPEDKAGAPSASGLSKRSSSKASSKTPSLVKAASDVEPGALVTKLSGLRSGSIVGETKSGEPEASTSRSDSATKLSPRKSLTKKLSTKKSSVRKSSSISKDVPSVPSGLTKLVLSKSGTSLNIADNALIDAVDESEIEDAVASLKSHLSKEKSKTGEAEPEAMNDEDEAVSDEPGPSTSAADVAMPPGGYLDIAISFDTTGSMMSYLEEVKAKVQNLVQRLQADIPGIHVAIIAHGDYIDEDKYVVKWIDFGASLPEICDFVTNVEPTYGGDGPECYELVLQRARKMLSWRPGSQKVLVMIGDDIPHEPGYTCLGKTYHIDWRDECLLLQELGIKVYGVQAGNDAGSTRFNKEMAKITNGRHLRLENLESCFDFLMMICYCEGNPDMLQTYEEEMRARDGRLNKDVSFCMAALGGGAAKPIKKTTPKKPTTTIKSTSKATSKTKTKTPSPKAPKKAKKTSPAKVSVKKASKVSTGKKKSSLKKKKALKSTRVLKREKLPDSSLSKGLLKQLRWSKWVCGIIPEPKGKKAKETKAKLTTKGRKNVSKAKKDNTAQFSSCKHWHGLRLKTLFEDETKTPAIYEVGVQCGATKTSKKFAMYFRRSRGWSRNGRSWDMYLFRHKTIKAEVNKALDSGYSIWIRRGVPPGKLESQKKKVDAANCYFRDHFDYAWKKYVWRKIDGRQKHRLVKVRGAILSHSDI